jgi:hypothetical protein
MISVTLTSWQAKETKGAEACSSSAASLCLGMYHGGLVAAAAAKPAQPQGTFINTLRFRVEFPSDRASPGP